MASLQETAVQARAHQPGRERNGGQGRGLVGLVVHWLIPQKNGTGPREFTTCQVQSKPNGVILLSHRAPLPRMLHTAEFDMASGSYQRNGWKKTTLWMTDYKDSESGVGVLRQEEGGLILPSSRRARAPGAHISMGEAMPGLVGQCPSVGGPYPCLFYWRRRIFSCDFGRG